MALFRDALSSEAPPLAWIQETETTELPATGEIGFGIRESEAVTGEFALVSPDVATCAECLADITDPGNRRFGYPFTNCTNCGPRYTIIRDIPYDRPNTTMAASACARPARRSMTIPANRRFHAQPNACPECGRSLSAPIAEAQRRLARARFWRSRGWADSTWPAMPRNDAAVGGCASASAAATSRSP